MDFHEFSMFRICLKMISYDLIMAGSDYQRYDMPQIELSSIKG